MVPQMAGPPPPELRDKFQVIKICTLTLFFCAIGRIVASFMFSTAESAEQGESGTRFHRSASGFAPAFSLLINAVIGTFLQNDDPLFRPIYEFFTNTCLKPCHDQGMCPGGMNCLFQFTVFNAISVVFELLLPPYNWLKVPDLLQMAMSGGSAKTIGAGLTAICVIGQLLAQFVGAFIGFKCIQAARQEGITAQGGEWGQEMARPGGGAGNSWGGGPLGGGPLGGGPFGAATQGRYQGLNYGGGNDEDTNNATPERTQVGGTGQNFQVFQGSGQRLGGD